MVEVFFTDYWIVVLLWSYFTGNTLIIVHIYQNNKEMFTYLWAGLDYISY